MLPAGRETRSQGLLMRPINGMEWRPPGEVRLNSETTQRERRAREQRALRGEVVLRLPLV